MMMMEIINPWAKEWDLHDIEELVTIPAATVSTSNIKSPYEGSKKGKNINKSESIADQSLRLRMKVLKELDFGVDIDLRGIGFVETGKARTGSETAAKSLSRKIIKEVSPKENIKNSGQKSKTYKLFFFIAEQSLVRKSKYLSENQTVFLRKDPQSSEELKNEADKNEEPSYWRMSQKSQAIWTISKAGLGLREMPRSLTNVTKLRPGPHPLVDRVGEEVTQRHLNKLISTQLILKQFKIREYVSSRGMMTKEVLKDFLLYFLANGTVKWMDMDTLIQNKRSEELAYVRFLLENRAKVTM